VPTGRSPSGKDPFTESANGQTAGSYTTDGQYNLGGWSTYPSKDELSLGSKRPRPFGPKNTPK
jgi:hypothetical protein